ncbi:MAG: signal peptidase I [Epulopiscium sp.]|nr:signal peptidase I [Candidatus Epulonipiscium sp.]
MEDNQNNTNKSFFKSEIFEFIRDIIFILAVVVFIRTFVFENTKVSGPSMEPTLYDGNILIVNKFEYRFINPKKGEIIVFPYKGDPSKHYIKRIIGLPGEVVDIRDGIVYIDGELLEEDYLLEPMYTMGEVTYPFKVPMDTYFVMGDNRNRSSDSRYQDVGTIEKSKITGRAVIRLWPFNQIGFIK